MQNTTSLKSRSVLRKHVLSIQCECLRKSPVCLVLMSKKALVGDGSYFCELESRKGYGKKWRELGTILVQAEYFFFFFIFYCQSENLHYLIKVELFSDKQSWQTIKKISSWEQRSRWCSRTWFTFIADTSKHCQYIAVKEGLYCISPMEIQYFFSGMQYFFSLFPQDDLAAYRT